MICPQCGGDCVRDEVDIGVGIQGGPWGCPDCHWVEDVDLTLCFCVVVTGGHLAVHPACPVHNSTRMAPR